MDISIKAKQVFGKVKVISSKSELHRLLIMSAFAKTESEISFVGTPSLDVLASIDCLKQLGADIIIDNGVMVVKPIKELPKERVKLFCNESGSTLRFMLPIVAVLGISAEILVSGRLKDRPLSPMYELLTENGVSLSKKGEYPLTINGKLKVNAVNIDGGVSSQFISGLLMALAVANENGKVQVTGNFQSKSYVNITVETIKKFGVSVNVLDNTYSVLGKEYSGKKTVAYGDWSNGAFFLSLGAISGKISVQGLDENSFQGDKEIVNLLKKFGAVVKSEKNEISVEKNSLSALEIDVSDIPDLVPVLSVVAGLSKGTTTIFNGERLRLKESDRIKSSVEMINSIGGKAVETKDGIIITGVNEYSGGVVDSYNDHRIVMASAIASARSKNEIRIINALAVNKSYPSFFNELKGLGFEIKEV
jgi:3-phosphoshikimate 1-carboxyvinyltransferase